MDKAQIINELMSYYKFKKYSDFAAFLDVKPQVLSNWISRNTFDIEIVYTKCVEINPDWLLTGKGEMLRNSNQNLQPVATNDQLSGVDVDNRNLLLDIQEKVDFIYTHALKEMAKKELEGLKNDIKKTKEGKK